MGHASLSNVTLASANISSIIIIIILFTQNYQQLLNSSNRLVFLSKMMTQTDAQTAQARPDQTPQSQTWAALPPPPPPMAIPQMMLVAPPPVAPAVIVIGNNFMQMDPLCESCGVADCGACCKATYCPCLAVGEIAESIGMDECLHCCAYASLCIFAGPSCADCAHGCCLAQTFRQQTGYNTHQNACTTCCCHYATDGKACMTWPLAPCLACCAAPCLIPLLCFVPPCSCALTQELRLARKIKAQQRTVVIAGPARQMM